MKIETGIGLIASERQRQIVEEEWDADHDSEHSDSALAIVGAMYAVAGVRNIQVIRVQKKDMVAGTFTGEDAWPEDWSGEWDKRGRGSRIRRLAKAGALIAAEIDRLLESQKGKER